MLAPLCLTQQISEIVFGRICARILRTAFAAWLRGMFDALRNRAVTEEAGASEDKVRGNWEGMLMKKRALEEERSRSGRLEGELLRLKDLLHAQAEERARSDVALKDKDSEIVRVFMCALTL
jgi:hypothetical protein